MKFFKQKLIINEKKGVFYRTEKKENFVLLFIGFIFISFFIKKIIIFSNKLEGINFLIFLIISILIVLIYIYSLLFNLSKEILELNKETVTIKKYIFFCCYYNKKILIEKIVRVSYRKTNSILILILFSPLFLRGNSSFIIQSSTNVIEDKEFYFGIGLNLESYSYFCKALKEIIGDNYRKIQFNQFLR